MRLQLESTDPLVEINGVPARVWEGKSESGIDVICFVTRIAVLRTDDTTQFDRELQEVRPPSEGAASFPSRMVL